MPGAGPFPDLKRLGFRVPAIAMGPFAPRKIEKAGPYEHCSILKMIEWRWGLEPMTLRDRYAKNLADALDFTKRRDEIDLRPFDVLPATAWTDRRGQDAAVGLAEGVGGGVVRSPEEAGRRGRLVTDDDKLELAAAPEATVRGGTASS